MDEAEFYFPECKSLQIALWCITGKEVECKMLPWVKIPTIKLPGFLSSPWGPSTCHNYLFVWWPALDFIGHWQEGAFRGVLLACWEMCLLPLAQPSGNNITHTERSWCQGQLSCKRWGRWETCIDFSFCWGKQACCSWARVQWGGQNVLDCSSSLSPVSCDSWVTPWKQLQSQKYIYDEKSPDRGIFIPSWFPSMCLG